MAPLKSSLARTVGKLLGVQKDRDLSLRGRKQSTREAPPTGTLSGSGGSVYTQGDYKLHVFSFPNSDSFVVTDAEPNATVEIFMVASGGSGAPDQGNGGGGGGIVWTDNGGIVISNGTYPVTISDASQNNAPGPGNPVNARGGDTVFGPNGGITLRAKGGGFGGYFSPDIGRNLDYRRGGCGGGMGNIPAGNLPAPDVIGADAYQPTEPQTFPTATNVLGNTATVLSQGFAGGASNITATSNSSGSGGGGGGAGQVGYGGRPPFPAPTRGRGGDGYQVPTPFLDPFKPVIPNPFLSISHADPAFLYFGGGGGGSDHNNNAGTGRGFGVPGGLGGGGRGATDPGPGTAHGEVGLNGRGGGGGGGSTHSGNGRSGGSGVCIIKYKFQ